MPKRPSDDEGAHPRPPRRGPREGRRELPPEMEALATGESRSLRRKQPRGPKKLSDPRERGLFPGVSNYDARAVYDARVARLQALGSQTDADTEAAATLDDELCTACRVRLWRARNVVGFEAFCADVLGLDPEEGKRRAAAGAERQGATLQPLPDAHVAAWMRAEAGLRYAGGEGRVRLSGPDAQPRLRLELPLERSAETLAEIGRREASLLRILENPSEPPPPRGAVGRGKPRPPSQGGAAQPGSPPPSRKKTPPRRS